MDFSARYRRILLCGLRNPRVSQFCFIPTRLNTVSLNDNSPNFLLQNLKSVFGILSLKSATKQVYLILALTECKLNEFDR